MLFFISMVLFLQDHNHGGEKVRFAPISAGNQIQIGSFTLTVPDGVIFADESNVEHMFRLTGADFIPNCVGMFASASGTWEYSITVQHYSKQAFSFSPILPPELFSAFFSEINLLTLAPNDGIANSLIPAQHDLEEQSLTFAMQYVGPKGDVMNCMKKVWVTGTDAMIYTLKASEPGFDGDFDQIDAVFGAVVRDPEAPKALPGPDTTPYYNLLGMNSKVTEPEPVSWTASLILIGVAFVLLIAAMKFRSGKSISKESN